MLLASDTHTQRTRLSEAQDVGKRGELLCTVFQKEWKCLATKALHNLCVDMGRKKICTRIATRHKLGIHTMSISSTCSWGTFSGLNRYHLLIHKLFTRSSTPCVCEYIVAKTLSLRISEPYQKIGLPTRNILSHYAPSQTPSRLQDCCPSPTSRCMYFQDLTRTRNV